jgi:hypothetical protein
MTSIEWLLEQVEHNISKTIIEQAKEMHYKELMDSMQKGMEIQQKYNKRKGFRERNNLLNDKKNG